MIIVAAIVVVTICLILLLVFGGGGGSFLPHVGPSGSSLSNEEVNQFLKYHNDYRSKAGARPLKWNNDLAAGAQAWVDHQKKNENCRMRHPTQGNEPDKYLHNDQWGQNLAWFEGKSGSPQESVQNWGPCECVYYDPSNPRQPKQATLPAGCDQTGQIETGHFTQLVWKDTTEVGCAKATCGNQTLWACDYNPAGNVFYNGGTSLFTKNVTKPNPCM